MKTRYALIGFECHLNHDCGRSVKSRGEEYTTGETWQEENKLNLSHSVYQPVVEPLFDRFVPTTKL